MAINRGARGNRPRNGLRRTRKVKQESQSEKDEAEWQRCGLIQSGLVKQTYPLMGRRVTAGSGKLTRTASCWR